MFSADSRAVHALGPLDLDVADGEFVAVVGPSGCGKSTFLRMVAGLVNPTEGEISLSVRDQQHATAMVFQEYSIFPWKRVIDNVRLGLQLRGVSSRESKERAMHYLDRLGLADRAEDYPQQLSGGMKQRVAIARALAVEPEILLMDEPFAALDAQLRKLLQDELLELWQSDRRTVLFITHSLEEAILLADRVVVMSARPGTVVASKTVPFERPRRRLGARRTGVLGVRSRAVGAVAGRSRTAPRREPDGAGEVSAVEPTPIHRRPGRAERDPVRHARRRRTMELSLAIAVPVVLIGMWQLAGSQGWIDRRLYPPPSDIVRHVDNMFADRPGGRMWRDVRASISRIAWGYFWGSITGLVAGYTLGLNRLLRKALDPTLIALYTVPKLALIGIFLLAFGLDETPVIIVIALTVFFFVFLQTNAAVLGVSEHFREAGRSLGAGRWQLFRHVILPASLPQVFVGLRIAAGVTVLTMIGAEFAYAPFQKGIGYRIAIARQTFDPPTMYLAVVLTSLIGVVFTWIVTIVGRLLTRWAPQGGGATTS